MGSLAVGYELVVGCDNPKDRGADQRRPETTPGAFAGGLVRAKTYLGKAIGAGEVTECVPGCLVERGGGGWGLVTIILAVLCKTGGVYIYMS